MSMHPHLVYQLARSRQEELRHQANLRSNRLSSRRQGRSSRRFLRRRRSWPLEASSPRPAPAR